MNKNKISTDNLGYINTNQTNIDLLGPRLD